MTVRHIYSLPGIDECIHLQEDETDFVIFDKDSGW